MSRRSSQAATAERLRRHLYAAADAVVELMLREADGPAAENDTQPPPRRTTAATVLTASDTDRAFAEKTMRANGWDTPRRKP